MSLVTDMGGGKGSYRAIENSSKNGRRPIITGRRGRDGERSSKAKKS